MTDILKAHQHSLTIRAAAKAFNQAVNFAMTDGVDVAFQRLKDPERTNDQTEGRFGGQLIVKEIVIRIHPE